MDYPRGRDPPQTLQRQPRLTRIPTDPSHDSVARSFPPDDASTQFAKKTSSVH
jgi:hypothetical protein